MDTLMAPTPAPRYSPRHRRCSQTDSPEVRQSGHFTSNLGQGDDVYPLKEQPLAVLPAVLGDPEKQGSL